MNGNLSQWVMEHTPPQVPSEFMHFLGGVMHHAAEPPETKVTEAPEKKGDEGSSK